MDHLEILVMGAGAVGGYFGGRISERTEQRVTFIARGAHLRAIQQKGLRINSIEGNCQVQLSAFEDVRKAPNPDVVLFTVKSHDTQEAILQIQPVMAEHTQVLTIQNGIENYPRLVSAFGRDRVLQGFCKIGVGMPEPGVIEHKAFGEITMGEQDGRASERTKNLQALFEEAGIASVVSDTIKRDVWLKFSWNCLLNMPTAAAGITIDKLFESEESTTFCYALFDEILAVAHAEDVSINKEDGRRIIESAQKLGAFETSTYQDRMKGKKMEYEAFAGAVARLGRKHNIPVPYHQSLYTFLSIIDNNRL